MIKQLLLFKFKESVTKDQIDLFHKKYKELTRLDCIKSVEFGENTSTEGFDKGFKYGAIATFEDKNSVEKFLENADHREVADKYLNPLLEDFILVEIKT